MWKQPYRLTDPFAELMWKMVRGKPGLFRIQLGTQQPAPPAQFTSHLLVGTQTILREAYVAKLGGDEVFYAQLREKFERFMVDCATQIETENRYLELASISVNLSSIGPLLAEEAVVDADVASFIAGLLGPCLLSLLGSERRLLVGVRNGVPAFNPTAPIQAREALKLSMAAYFMVFCQIHEIGPAEAAMLPDCRDHNHEALGFYAYGNEYLEANSALIEDAFYNQRYIIDPEGALVELSGAQGIRKLLLKVRARTDHALVDILAKVTTDQGTFFAIISEERLMNPGDTANNYPTMGSYTAHIVCQVYHGLVTAETIEERALGESRTKSSALGAGPPGKPHWMVVPRRISRATRPGRHKLDHPTIMQPRQVSGYTRKGTMSAKHRLVLEQFEQEHHLVILRFIPPGKTFVRPYISPKMSAEEFLGLPRFIRYRVQQRIEQAFAVPPEP